MSAAVRSGSDALLIPYLNRGKYFGVEPNEWLVEAGIEHELGEDVVQIKRPTFFFSDSPETVAQAKVSFDFALAQSIFSHCGLDLIKRLVVRDFAFTGSGWSFGCDIFARRGRLCANGLDLSRMCELPASDTGTRSRRSEFAI